jgi:hypothetical protein
MTEPIVFKAWQLEEVHKEIQNFLELKLSQQTEISKIEFQEFIKQRLIEDFEKKRGSIQDRYRALMLSLLEMLIL